MTMIQRRTGFLAIAIASALWCLCAVVLPTASAQQREDPARVGLASSLHQSADQDSAVIGKLRAGESVKVLQMRGAYSQIRAKIGRGWVLSSRLQIGGSASQRSSSSSSGGSSWLRGLTGLFGGSKSSRGSGAQVSVGVRGLQREDVAGARPNPAAVDRLDRLAVSASEAKSKARAAGLRSVDIAYLDAQTTRRTSQSDDSPVGSGSDR